MHISIIIRTLNEAVYLDDLLQMIARQNLDGLTHDVVLVDSGSTDGTVAIAHRHDCEIVTISKTEFSFGRSLNRGCEAATGDILVFISGHCVPARSALHQTDASPNLFEVGPHLHCYKRIRLGGFDW